MLLFWERGYEAVAIRDLAAAMGIGLTSMYAAFRDKRALFEEAVDRYAERYGRYVEASLSAESAHAAVAELLSTAAIQQSLPGRPPGCLIINGATNYGLASADVAAGLRNRRTHVIDAIEAKIRADARSGALPAHTDARALAGTVGAVWQGMAQSARDGANRNDLKAIARTALTALGLDGYGPKPQQLRMGGGHPGS